MDFKYKNFFIILLIILSAIQLAFIYKLDKEQKIKDLPKIENQSEKSPLDSYNSKPIESSTITPQYENTGLPKGWSIERNIVSNEWRWCDEEDICGLFSHKTKGEAINSAIMAYKSGLDDAKENWRKE